MNTVFTIGNFEVTIMMLGIPVALIVWLIMFLIWSGMYKKTIWAGTLEGTGAGKRLNAAGFGLLPALAVFRLFTVKTELARGRISHSGWLKDTAFTMLNGDGQTVYCLALISTVGLLLLFALLVLWLALRKERIPDNGDVLWTSVTGLGALMIVISTIAREDGLKLGNMPVQVWIGFLLIMIPLLVWAVRNGRQKKNTAYIIVCTAVFFLTAAVVAVREYSELLGNETVTLTAIRTGASLLAVKATLCLGRVSRNGD